VISVAFKTPLKTRLGVCIFKTPLKTRLGVWGVQYIHPGDAGVIKLHISIARMNILVSHQAVTPHFATKLRPCT